LGPNTGALAPHARAAAVRVRGYHPQKIFENSDANSCILVTTCCEISCFFENYGQEVGVRDQYIVSPGCYGCYAYESEYRHISKTVQEMR